MSTAVSRLRKITPVAESKSRVTEDFARGLCKTGCPIYRTVRSAFRRGCLEVNRKTACDFVHQRRDGYRHAADFLIVEHHLLG